MKRKPNRARGKSGQTDWAKQVRFDMEYAKKRLLNEGGVEPLFLIHTPTTIYPVVSDFIENKERIRAMVTLMCLAHAAIGISFIGEAWMSRDVNRPDRRQQPGESWQDWERRIGTPSESETRVEVIIVQSTFYDDDTGERTGMAEMREVLRDAAGKPTGLGAAVRHEHGMDPDQEIRGPTFEILPERRASPYEQQTAKDAMEAMGIRPVKLTGGNA